MTIVRAQCAWQADSAQPSDAQIITPHFKFITTPLTPADYEAFAQALADALNGWSTFKTTVTVKLYNAQAPEPNYPLAVKTNPGAGVLNSTVNRDVAVCLSYYAEFNRPRHRGRLYVPCGPASISPAAASVNSTQMAKVGDLATVLANAGGVDVDWSVFSRMDNTSRPVTNWFVDNAWDTQRRRGVKSTARITGTVPEAGPPNLVGFNPADAVSTSL
jgi:hypothetical protein